MDRILRVKKGDTIYAELDFMYERQLAGKVHIILYRVYDMGDDMTSSYPLIDFETYFNHGDFKTIEEFKNFDKKFLKGQPGGDDSVNLFDGTFDFTYEPVNYRYYAGHRDPVGIVEINADFLENKKNFKFLSARRQKEDLTIESDSFEPNLVLMKRIFEEYLDVYGTDIRGIGWN